jgi:hypothetical protein
VPGLLLTGSVATVIGCRIARDSGAALRAWQFTLAGSVLVPAQLIAAVMGLHLTGAISSAGPATLPEPPDRLLPAGELARGTLLPPGLRGSPRGRQAGRPHLWNSVSNDLIRRRSAGRSLR